jgi:hypothetical protein
MGLYGCFKLVNSRLMLVLLVFYGGQHLLPRPGILPRFFHPQAPAPLVTSRAKVTAPSLSKLCLPRRVRERILGGLFLRFLEAFFGSKVLFFFIRNAWVLLGPLVTTQEFIFARRISQYSSWGARHRRGQWWWGSKILALAVGSKDPELLIS